MEKLLRKYELSTKGKFVLRIKSAYENFGLRKS